MPLMAKASFGALPSDVLYEIVPYNGSPPSMPRRYRLPFSLAHVNRHLRQFALPILLSEIVVSTEQRLTRFLDFMQTSSQKYSSYVKTLRIRIPEGFPLSDISDVEHFSIFTNLMHFECLSCVCDAALFAVLKNSSRILSLSVMCDPADAIHFRGTSPSLTSLHLKFHSPSSSLDVTDKPSFSPMLIPSSLTNLVLSQADSKWLGVLHGSTFPQLEAFTFSSSEVIKDLAHERLFQFIERHPHLTEVNVSGAEVTLGAIVDAI
ncbi:hypothetical protein HGRIS_012821 [Hohenbuehelia grisea]|uniref:Uncharacterized protein n=1 Tax=Hohenbuehelia grisea TaxID=104357 RepID=A0ABR3ITG0_9AGAR